MSIYAALPGGGTSGEDLIQTPSPSKTFFVPKLAQTFTYDYAGNLTQDSVWDYTYDAENRLISMQHRSEVIGTGMLPDDAVRRLEFLYDYLGRRVQKIVRSGWSSSTSTFSTSTTHKYLYDGWNLIEDLDATSTLTLVRSYTWGLDLTGSFDAAGGVGALLQIRDHALSRTWLPTYDGNGNVASLLDAEAGSSGSIAAVYEYGPFGESVRAEAVDADAAGNSFRFSTKLTDAETGLVYYGLRYYSPTFGRFINRDPIEESGGLNLYGFCRNNGINKYDLLGMWPTWGPYPAHQNSIDRVFGTNATEAMKMAQVVADSFQGVEDSFIHAMTGRDPSYQSYYRIESDLFVNYAFDASQQAASEGDKDSSDFYLGLGIHALQDATSPPHQGFAVWLGLAHIMAAAAHVAAEFYDPGYGSALDGATGYGDIMRDLPRDLRPSDFFVYINESLLNKKDSFDYAKAWKSLTPKQQSEATSNAKKAVAEALARYKKLLADIKSGEYDRVTSFQTTLDLGEAYIGTDDWLDAHTNPAHWKSSLLFQGFIYSEAMWAKAQTAADKAAYSGMAAFYSSQYQMEADRLEAVEASEAVLQGKAL